MPSLTLINSLFSIRLLRPVTRTFRITLITLSRLLGCRLNSCDCFKITRHQVKNNFVHLKNLFVLNNWCLCTEDAGVRGRLTECLETILNKAQEPPKSKKVQHSNAKNAVLFEAISLIIHADSDATLLVRGCNQLGQFLSHRETNLRYLALESLCLLATSEFSHDSVKKHQETVINALKVLPSFSSQS